MITELAVAVPGKLMLCGEYRVLTPGVRALAFALDSYLEVYARYGTTARQSLTLSSNLWDAPLQVDADTDSSDMLVATVRDLMPAGEHKVEELRVTSQLHPTYGFGSSSALRLALTFIAYVQQRGGSLIVPHAKRWQLAGQAFELQKKSQGLASGYDVATQFVGGIVDYRSRGGEWPYFGAVKPMRSIEYEDLHATLTEIVHIFVGGEGTDTAAVIQDTKEWIDSQGHLPMLYATDALHFAFDQTLRAQSDLRALIKATAQWRQWFSESPHFPIFIEDALSTVKGLDRRWSWKTSGAGGEDALIVIGLKEDIAAVTARLAELDWLPHDYNIAERGMRLQRIKH